MGENGSSGMPPLACLGRPELVPLGGVRPVVGQKPEQVREPLAGEAVERDRGREVRWTGHGLMGQGGVGPGGVGMDGATHQSAVLLEDGCSVVPAGACQNQWHAHRFPRFLPDS